MEGSWFLWGLAAEGSDPVSRLFHKPEAVFHGLPFFGEEGFLPITNLVLTSWGVILLLVLLSWLATRNLSKVPRGWQNLFEMLFSFLEGWLAGFLGDRQTARKFLPLLATFFLYILIGNYSGILPMAGKWHFPYTGRWGTTAGLAIVTFLAVQYVNMKEHGFKGYLKSFVHADGVMGYAMIPLAIMEEFVRPFSLSLRLFGNIFAEETLLAVFLFLLPAVVPLLPMGLALLFGALQAVVFTTLSAIYIGMALHSHHGDEHAHAH